MILALIPSRLKSTRLTKKPLLEIDGLPIIVHTFKRVLLSKKIDKVIVCTDSNEIKNVVEEYGGEAILTSKKHKNGTERIAEVAKKFKARLIVDIQGDEPLVDPTDIDKVITYHQKNSNFDIILPIKKTKNADDKSLIKVVYTNKKKIMYFSRAQIPYNFKNKKINYFKDLSVISFKPNALQNFAKFKPSSLEITEGIELLRALENDLSIGTFISKGSSFGVNIKQDFMKAVSLMPKNKFRKFY